MLATCICLNGSLLDQLSCTIVYLHNLFTCTFGRINMSVCLSSSVGPPGNCQSSVLEIENVDVRQRILFDISPDDVHVS